MSWGGESLRVARQEKGYSVEDIASRLKIPARYVSALESEDGAGLPEATFVRGYIRSYARLVGLDPEPMLAAFAPVEVKAPKPLVGIEGTTLPKTGTRRGARSGARPAFRLHRHHWVAGGVLAVLAALASTWLGREPAAPVRTEPVTIAVPAPAPAAPSATPAEPATPAPAGVDNALTRDVPLPALPSTAPAASVAAPAANAAPSGATAGALPPPAPATAAAPAAAAVKPAPGAVPVPAAAPVVTTVKPAAKGLTLHFRASAWVEVRDAANLVIHSSFAPADSTVTLDGKAPLTVTLGDASAAEIWWNGERVSTDRYARSGVARITVGKAMAR